MTSESKARLQIDQKLEQAGWGIQDMKQLNLGAGTGVVVRAECAKLDAIKKLRGRKAKEAV